MEQSIVIKNIISLLKEQKKTQKNLTDHLGITQNAFTDWKSGRIKSYTKHLPQIADYFGVSVDYLLGNNTAEEMHTPTEPKLSEGEKIWLQLYNSVSEDTRNILIGMMIAIDKLPTEEKEEALSRVRDDLKSLE